MITLKNDVALIKMGYAGQLLSGIFKELHSLIVPGTTSLALDGFIEERLVALGMKSMCKGYHGYRHVSCIAVNDEVVHGVPNDRKFRLGDMVKVDVCASYQGYCADMARCFFVGTPSKTAAELVSVAQLALDAGIAQAFPGNRLSNISVAIQRVVQEHGFGVVRDYAGHGIGRRMHEDPEILNYGVANKGPVLQVGMTFAIEPMITAGGYTVVTAADGWTVKTKDGSLAAHVEDTIAITTQGPIVLTRVSER